MNNCSYMLVLCFAVVLSARLTIAIGGFEMELLMTKLDYLQDKLQEVGNSLQETEHRLQEKLTKHEKNINEKIETIEARMYAMEDSLKKSATDLKQLGENKKTLDMLTDSVRNVSILSQFNTQLLHMIHPVSSCRQALNVSGKYMIKIGINTEPFEVFCEQNKFEGGWIVIQHRYDGSVDFYRNWTEYRNGFGNLEGEFWLGLEYVHQITKNRSHELLVEMKDCEGNYRYAKYDGFEIGDESELYVLKKLGKHSGTVGDSMRSHKNHKFSTFDRDNDTFDTGSCAKSWHGAWWYNRCYHSTLNGRYRTSTGDHSAMVWYHLKNDTRGLSYSRMMIRDIID